MGHADVAASARSIPSRLRSSRTRPGWERPHGSAPSRTPGRCTVGSRHGAAPVRANEPPGLAYHHDPQREHGERVAPMTAAKASSAGSSLSRSTPSCHRASARSVRTVCFLRYRTGWCMRSEAQFCRCRARNCRTGSGTNTPACTACTWSGVTSCGSHLCDHLQASSPEPELPSRKQSTVQL